MEIGPVTLEGAHVRLESMRAEHADGLVAAGTGHGLFRFFPFPLESPEAMRAFVAALHRRARAGHPPPVHDDRPEDGADRRLDLVPRDRAARTSGSRSARPGSRRRTSAARSTPRRSSCSSPTASRCSAATGSSSRPTRATRRRAQRSRGSARSRKAAFRAHMVMPDGALRTSVYFSVIASEWPAVKARLAQKLARSG